MLLNNKYVVLENIASGQFGKIVKVEYNTNYYAIKLGSRDVIKYEATIYKKLKGVANISRLYDMFEYDDRYCIVLDYYSKTLESIKQEFFVINSTYAKCIINYLKDLIIIIKSIHNKYILHRDLKPSNICLDSTNKLFLIDFGIAKTYSNGSIHNKCVKINGLLGSVNFSSLNIINLNEPSRRDDIESVIYILVYMLLPSNIYNEYNNLDSIHKKDIVIIIDILKNVYANIINYVNLSKVFNYIRRLKYDQQPNYDYVIGLVLDLIE
jgi:serine/threonine protein kinase